MNHHAFLFFFLWQVVGISAQQTTMSPEGVLLIKEAFRIQAQLGHLVWDEWNEQKVPFLYKDEQNEYLFYHDDPPKEFSKIKVDGLSDPVYFKKSDDKQKYSATFPVNEKFTVVMSAPECTASKAEWLLRAAHEMFHIYQHRNTTENLRKKMNFREKNYKNTNDLNFPYDFSDKAILAIHKLEADRIFKVITADTMMHVEQNILKRRLADLYLIQQEIFPDSLHVKYKASQEWSEGVARYVEQQLALLASDSTIFKPSAAFASAFPDAGFNTLNNRYSQSSAIAPIRFVGEGVSGRIMFYYTGMGKAYLLDILNPEWKKHYFNATLNEQIIGKEQGLISNLNLFALFYLKINPTYNENICRHTPPGGTGKSKCFP